MNTKRKGNKAEAVILSEFVKRGFPTMLPFGDNEKYDIVVEINGEFKSIQIKHGRYDNGCVKASVKHRADKDNSTTYIGKVDYIAIWCEEVNECYLLNLKTFLNKGEAILRIEPPKNNSSISTVVWAKDYELRTTLDRIINY